MAFMVFDVFKHVKTWKINIVAGMECDYRLGLD
jgi:hypothetical protein